MDKEKKKEIEQKFRDRLMGVFLQACNESGFELAGVEMVVEEIKEVHGGHEVFSSLSFFWADEIEEADPDGIDMEYLAGLNRNLPRS